MDILLFGQLKLDEHLISVQQMDLSEDDDIPMKYIDKVFSEADEDLADLFESKGYAKQRMYVFHPDTKKSYLEIISIMTCNDQYYSKKRYAMVGSNIDIDSIRKTSPNKTMYPMVKLKPGEAKNLLLYLASKGLIFEIVSETLDGDD